MKFEESSIELELKELLSGMNLFLKIADIQNLQKIFSKVIFKIKELRGSRDLWRRKFEELKIKFKEDKK